ncbi:cytochrome b [Massilia aerilata]|uniref:Cytochrome b n=1 Tax=Massilia aerilata TaxID=453817 RepID=A0ABW0RVF8_9BURK
MKSDPASNIGNITRVAAGDDRTVYDNFAVFLHWLTVLLVLSQFALALTWEWFARPTRHLMIVAHMSFGIILAAVIVVRLVWRLLPGHQVAPAVSGWVEMASKAVHYLLYAMLAAEAVLGFMLRWSGDESMSFFGLLIAPPFAPFSKPAHHLVGELHELNGWAIIILAAGHAAAALYHHYVLRDRVLSRMLPPLREG